MKKFIFGLLLAGGSMAFLAGCGGESNEIPAEEKEEVQKIEVAVEDLDEASEEVKSKKEDAKASLNELMKKFNQE